MKKALSSIKYIGSPYGNMRYDVEPVLGDLSTLGHRLSSMGFPNTYYQEIEQSKFFYKYDPIASTVVNRIADMSVDNIYNRKRNCSDLEIAYFNIVLDKIKPLLNKIAIEYLLVGMVVLDYGLEKRMSQYEYYDTGRKKLYFPEPIWIRDYKYIALEKKPADAGKYVYIRIPESEKSFFQNKGELPDGTYDKELYEQMVKQFPEYVSMVMNGATKIRLDTQPILRKDRPHEDNPQPYLTAALSSLKHKMRIKQMDFFIASKVLEAICHIKAGNNDFPIEEDSTMLEEIRQQMASQDHSAMSGSVYRLFTDHTVNIEWVYPPLDGLLSDDKYVEPNADIFLALGFPRILLVGESLKSNAGQSVTTTLGPISAINDIRNSILNWIKYFYTELAKYNKFNNTPEPIFSPVSTNSMASLINYAIAASGGNIISKDTVARLFGTDFATELEQMVEEQKLSKSIEPKETASPVVKTEEAPEEVNNTLENNIDDKNDGR